MTRRTVKRAIGVTLLAFIGSAMFSALAVTVGLKWAGAVVATSVVTVLAIFAVAWAFE